MADGLNNQEIANKLIVAQSTVKKHINSIFGKLGAQHRAQAIARARELKLALTAALSIPIHPPPLCGSPTGE